MADRIIKGFSKTFFKSLNTLNLSINLGILIVAVFSQKISSVVFAGIFFLMALGVYVLGEWYDEWKLSVAKKTAYIVVFLVFVLKLFTSSYALMFYIITDIILVEIMFSKYVSEFRKRQNILPLIAIMLGLLVIFIDQLSNVIHPNIFNATSTLEILIFAFVILKLGFASSLLFSDTKRSAAQRLKEEQFIDYSADFNNFFSHYINTPLTTAISNLEILRYKLEKKINPEVMALVEKNFSVVSEGLENISKTTRELSNIHYIRSEVLRHGTDIWSLEQDMNRLLGRFNAELEQVIDEWPKIAVPKLMVIFSLEHILLNAQSYRSDVSRIRVVVHQESKYLVISTFNKGNIPDFVVDVLQPFQRGENVNEGTGTGLGLSLIGDLIQDHGCEFSLTNVGGYTRAKIKLPLYYQPIVLSFESSGLPSREPNTDADDSTVSGYQAHA